jgi:hypothetical protein
VRVYDVADLVRMFDPAESPPTESPSSVDTRENGTTAGSGASPGERPVARASEPVPDFYPLVDLIKHTIRPDQWEDLGGPGAIAPHEGSLTLVILQTPFVHERIEDLFQQLREKKEAE